MILPPLVGIAVSYRRQGELKNAAHPAQSQKSLEGYGLKIEVVKIIGVPGLE